MDEVIKLGYLAGATRFRRISDKLYMETNYTVMKKYCLKQSVFQHIMHYLYPKSH